MRITGGSGVGVTLKVPRKGAEIRPATDRMREAVFSSLGSAVDGARVLDLFAGTGAYGLESASRGANEVIWVESTKKVATILAENRAALEKSMGKQFRGRILVRDFRRHGLPAEKQFDLIFADPPYNLAGSLLPEIFMIAEHHLANHPDAKFLLEVRGDLAIEQDNWKEVRCFGKDPSGPSVHVLLRNSQ